MNQKSFFSALISISGRAIESPCHLLKCQTRDLWESDSGVSITLIDEVANIERIFWIKYSKAKWKTN